VRVWPSSNAQWQHEQVSGPDVDVVAGSWQTQWDAENLWMVERREYNFSLSSVLRSPGRQGSPIALTQVGSVPGAKKVCSRGS
jgi:hypothetical protein